MRGVWERGWDGEIKHRMGIIQLKDRLCCRETIGGGREQGGQCRRHRVVLGRRGEEVAPVGRGDGRKTSVLLEDFGV